MIRPGDRVYTESLKAFGTVTIVSTDVIIKDSSAAMVRLDEPINGDDSIVLPVSDLTAIEEDAGLERRRR